MNVRVCPLPSSSHTVALLALSIVLGGACSPGLDEPAPEPLAAGPWIAGAPAGSPAAALGQVAEYSATLQSPPTATLESVRERAIRSGVRVASINSRLGVPSVMWARAETTAKAPEAAALDYLTRYQQVYALSDGAVATATVRRVHDIGRGPIVVTYGQEIGGIEIYGVASSVVMDRDNRLVAITGNLHPAARLAELPELAMTDDEALGLAIDDASSGPVQVLTRRVRPVLYPLTKSLVMAQRIEFELAAPGSANSRGYEYVIASDGRILERINRTLSESFDYRVWADDTAPFRPLDGPHGDGTPHPTGDADPPVALTFVAPSLISIEGFNTNPGGGSDPWLPANATVTTGNNVDAYADHGPPDGFNVGDIRADLSGALEFDYIYDTGEEPFVDADQTKAATVQLFYTINWLHDYFYDSGFDEAAGNAQADNFGRGGEAGDVLLAEAQDSGGVNRNNANMFTPSDGTSPRMQMFVWDSVVGPVRDGTIDNGIVAHEWGHYFHHRLSRCLGTAQCNSLSEGWGDFLSMHLMVREGDDLDGTYSIAPYSVGNFYFGIRRAPYSTRFNRNALTFGHIANAATLPSDQHPMQLFQVPNSESHMSGEIWTAMLTEAYFSLIREDRLTFGQAQRRMADYIVAGLLAVPANATFTETRDAILVAAAANDPADMLVLAQAFARRGAGTTAQSPARDSTSFNDVVENFEIAGTLGIPDLAVAANNDCDADDNLDAGESAVLQIAVANEGPLTLTGTSVQVATTSTSVSFPDGQSVSVDEILGYSNGVAELAIELADDVSAPALINFDVTVANSESLTPQVTGTLIRRVNIDDVPASSSTDDVESKLVVWSVATSTEAFAWDRQPSSDGSNTLWRVIDPPVLAEERLESPPLQVGTGDFVISFDHRFKFETSTGQNFDGGVIEISSDGGASYQDVGAAAAGYGGTLFVGSGNPLGGRQAFVGQSAGYPLFTSATINLGTQFSGQTVQIRFRLGADQAVGDDGWEIDDISFAGITNTPFATIVNDVTECVDDPDPDPDPDPNPNPEDGGCGCQSSGGPGGTALLALLCLVALSRRRRRG